MATTAEVFYRKEQKKLIKENRIRLLRIDEIDEIESLNFINIAMQSEKNISKLSKFA